MRAFHLWGMIGSPLRYMTNISLNCIWHGGSYLSYCLHAMHHQDMHKV